MQYDESEVLRIIPHSPQIAPLDETIKEMCVEGGKPNQHSPVGPPTTTPATSTAQWDHPPAIPVQKQLKGTL